MSNADQPVSSLEKPIPGSYEERLVEAQRLKNRGDTDEALEVLDRISGRILRLPERRRQSGSDLWLHLLAAMAMTADIKSDTGDIAAADALWEQLEQLDPARRSTWRRTRYMRQIGRGEVEEGLRALQALAEEDPDDINNWLAATQSALTAGQYDNAEAWLQQAERLLDEDESGEFNASFHLMRYGLNVKREHWPEAMNDWYQAMEFDEDLAEYVESALRTLLAAEQYDLALELLDDEAFGPALALFYQAWIAQRRGDIVRARHLWRQILDVPEDEGFSFVQLKARALCWLGRPHEAIAMLLREVELSDELDAIDALGLALAWGMAGKLAEARANLATALRLAAPDEPLTALEWFEFDALISDERVKAELREYFDLESEQSSAAETP